MEEPHRQFLHSPLIIGLLGVAAGAIIVATYHCLVNNCCFIQSRISSALQSEQTVQVLPTTNHNRTRSTISTNTTFPSHLIPVYTYTKECREGISKLNFSASSATRCASSLILNLGGISYLGARQMVFARL
ncbi:hypothetical protein ACLB2K_056655 [Fragaria x ananassa]